MCPARVAAKNGALKRYARSIMLLYAKSVSQIITSDEIFKSGLSFCLFHQNIFLRCKKLFINFNTHTCRDLCSRVKSLLGHMCPGWFLGKRTSLKKSANVKVHWEPMTSCVTNKNLLIKKRKFSDFLEGHMCPNRGERVGIPRTKVILFTPWLKIKSREAVYCNITQPSLVPKKLANRIK